MDGNCTRGLAFDVEFELDRFKFDSVGSYNTEITTG